ncbi:MAG: ROK family protein [Planctomycetota bacterium]
MTHHRAIAYGVDVGGLGLKAVKVGLSDAGLERLTSKKIVLADGDRSEEGILKAIAGVLRQLGAGPQATIGLAVAGSIRKSDGLLLEAANFPAWKNFALADRLAEFFETPTVSIDNDANLFLRGEADFGAARGFESCLGLTLGTGLGGGLMIDRKIYRGHRGLAGEVGHVVYDPNGPKCGCGAHGCIEQYASTQFLWREGRLRCTDLMAGVSKAETGWRLAAAARDGLVTARQLFVDLGQHLGTAIAGVLNLLDVESVLIGGGLENSYDLFGLKFEQVLRARVFTGIGDDLIIARAELGDDAGALGAAAMASQF